MDSPTKYIGLIAGGVALAVSTYGAVTYMHDKLQQIDEQKAQIEREGDEIKDVRGNVLLLGIKEDIRWTQRRMFRIEDVYGNDLKDAPGLVREEYKQDRIDLENLQQELRATQRVYKALK